MQAYITCYTGGMKVTPIKTEPVNGPGNLTSLIDRYIPSLPDQTIVAVTSKIISICEGRLLPIGDVSNLEALVRQEADYYRAPTGNPHGYHVTIKSSVLVASAGIDRSNGDGHYVLWPADPQASANALRRHLAARPGARHVGVVITDSRSTPLRRGTLGVALAHSGFAALRHYAGRPDLFGRPLKTETAGLADGLAAAAVAVMGEGAESTPLALIEDLGFLEFQDRDPTPAELSELRLSPERDFFAELFARIPWDKRPR
jgi:dihydrofolate synthase / folylpolyglutamate synthase